MCQHDHPGPSAAPACLDGNAETAAIAEALAARIANAHAQRILLDVKMVMSITPSEVVLDREA